MSGRVGIIIIDGDPYGKRAPQIARRGQHSHLHPHKLDKEYAKRIAIELAESKFIPITDNRAPIWVEIAAYFSRPDTHLLSDGKSLSAEGKRWLEPTKKPDTDNISKIILDTFTHAGVWPDDSQVTMQNIEKAWSEEPCVIVKWGVR